LESGWQEKGVKQPGVFEVEAVGDGDIGGRGDEEWRVVGGRPAKRGQGRVREGAVPLGVKEGAVEASEDGGFCLFVHVKRRSRRGSSWRKKRWIRVLNLSAREELKFGVFFSWG
jgi:hypothetical protein